MAVMKAILNEIEIHNFRAITSLKTPLTKINIFVGRNNTGKTTILEALALLLSSFNEYKDFIENNILDLITQYRGGPRYLVKMDRSYARISATLSTGDKLHLYIIENLEESKEINPAIVNRIEQALDQEVDSMYQEKINELEREIEMLIERIERYPKDSLRRKELEREINRYRQKLNEYINNKDEVLSFLRSRLKDKIILYMVTLINDTVVNINLYKKRYRYFDEEENTELRQIRFTNLSLQPIYVRMYREKLLIEKLDDLPIDRIIELVERLRIIIPYFYDYRNGMVIFKFNDKKEIVPINVVGDGLLALLELFMPSIYGVTINLVEEPELHMHPGFLEKYTRELIRFACEHNIQYVMTTHSLEFLEYLLDSAKQQNMLDEVNIIRLYRLPDGEIDYEVLSGNEAYDELENIKGDLRGP